MKKTELVKVLGYLASIYQTGFKYPIAVRAFNARLESSWYESLQDFTPEEAIANVKLLSIAESFPPRPEQVKDVIIKNRETEGLVGIEAWGLAQKAATGRMPVKDLPANILAMAENVGGLRAIGGDPENSTFRMSAFVRGWNEVKARDNTIRRKALCGIKPKIDGKGPKSIGDILPDQIENDKPTQQEGEE